MHTSTNDSVDGPPRVAASTTKSTQHMTKKKEGRKGWSDGLARYETRNRTYNQGQQESAHRQPHHRTALGLWIESISLCLSSSSCFLVRLPFGESSKISDAALQCKKQAHSCVPTKKEESPYWSVPSTVRTITITVVDVNPNIADF